MERVEFLEKKIKQQSEERDEDNQRFMKIIGKSKELFKNLFEPKETNEDPNRTFHSESAVTIAGATLDTTVPSVSDI